MLGDVYSYGLDNEKSIYVILSSGLVDDAKGTTMVLVMWDDGEIASIPRGLIGDENDTKL